MAPFLKKIAEPHSRNESGKTFKEFSALDALEAILRRWSHPLLIGRITPEVIHDINNFLTGILGYAELLTMKPLQDEGIKKGLNTIAFSAEKCKVLLGRIVALSKEEGTAVRLGQANDWIEEALDLRRCAFRHQQIVVVTDLSPDLPILSVDGLYVQKALLHMFFSAEEALAQREDGRRIEIKTRFEPQDQRVIITLSANGKGMDFAVWRGLLEKGSRPNWLKMESQFGLWLAGQWIGEMGGTLHLETEGDEGPVFVLRLPVKGKD